MRVEKLSTAARRAVVDLDVANWSVLPLRVLIRLKGEPDDEQLRLIADAGARVNIVAGDVLTASVDRTDLGRVTEVDSVDYVELSQPLHPEGMAMCLPYDAPHIG